MISKTMCCCAILIMFLYAPVQSFGTEMQSAVSRSLSFLLPVPQIPLGQNEFVATRLFVSRDRGTTWRIAATHAQTVKQIAVEAQDDGDYWFAIRRLTAQGGSSPNTPLQPELQVLVDTTPPQLQLSTRQQSAGQLLISVESSDRALLPGSLEIRVLSADPLAKWQRVPVDPRSLTLENGRLKAAIGFPLTTPFDLTIRASIWDKVGHKNVAETRFQRQTRLNQSLDFTAGKPAGISTSPILANSRLESQAGAMTYVGSESKTPGVAPYPVATLDRAGAMPLETSMRTTDTSGQNQIFAGSAKVQFSNAANQTAAMTPKTIPATTFPVATFVGTANADQELSPEPNPLAITDADLELLERLVERQPNNLRLREALAELLTMQHDYARAEVQWRYALKLKPDNLPARQQLATCLTAQNRQVEAAQVLDQAISTP